MGASSHARLSIRLALASLAAVAAITVVCVVGLVSVRQIGAMSRQAVSRQLAILHDSSAFQGLLYQKGFVAEYMLTGDGAWLDKLDDSRTAFASWLVSARRGVDGNAATGLIPEIDAEYRAYDAARTRAIRLYDEGRIEPAKALLSSTQEHAGRLLGLFRRFDRAEADEAEQTLAAAEVSTRRRGEIIVVTALVGVLASLATGYLWARRVSRPIYQLQLQVRSAAEMTRVEVRSIDGSLADLPEQITAIARRLQDADASLVEHRRRLLQSEKLSAVGELAAKLAHEILNPLAGMKVATQVLARGDGGDVQRAAQETARSIGREIARVEELVRRLLDYSRPLAPRIDSCSVSDLVDGALAATREEIGRAGASVERREAAGLPDLRVDPLLMMQALANVLANAAQAMQSPGGTIVIAADRALELGREHVHLQVVDQGPGIAAGDIERIFDPFFTTKASGHGLGLAVSHNILLEHRGRLGARNRELGRGAIFDLWIPVDR